MQCFFYKSSNEKFGYLCSNYHIYKWITTVSSKF